MRAQIEDHPILNPLYMQDLEQGLKLLHELNSVAMSGSRRDKLETALEAVKEILGMYWVDYR